MEISQLSPYIRELRTILRGIERAVKCPACQGSGGAGSTNVPIVTDFQPLDCNGDDVGAPLDVVPMIQMGRVDTNICNIDAIATAINGGDYNFNIHHATTPGEEFSTTGFGYQIGIQDDYTIHSISYTVLPGGTADITINGVTITDLPSGYTGEFTASSSITNNITIESTSTARVVFTAIVKNLN